MFDLLLIIQGGESPSSVVECTYLTLCEKRVCDIRNFFKPTKTPLQMPKSSQKRVGSVERRHSAKGLNSKRHFVLNFGGSCSHRREGIEGAVIMRRHPPPFEISALQ